MVRFIEGVVKGDAYLPGIIWEMWGDELPYVLPWDAIESFRASKGNEDEDEDEDEYEEPNDTECPYCGTMFPSLNECPNCHFCERYRH